MDLTNYEIEKPIKAEIRYALEYLTVNDIMDVIKTLQPDALNKWINENVTVVMKEQ